jgi:hypothetical protein
VRKLKAVRPGHANQRGLRRPLSAWPTLIALALVSESLDDRPSCRKFTRTKFHGEVIPAL